MLATQIFWASLWLPGLALLRLVWPRTMQLGAMGAVALGYLASLALLSPVSIACYWLRLPVGVFTAACVLSVLAAGAWLLRQRAWRGMRGVLRGELAVAALIVAVDLCLQGRVGSWLDGDATFHLGRIRHLLEHGFSNDGIYVSGEPFITIYNTNLVHALLASASTLTTGDPLETWRASLPWAKLMIAAGHFTLGYALSGRREVGWLLAVLVTATQAGLSYAVYPNTLAVAWILPTILALGVWGNQIPRGLVVVAIAVASFVLGQVHALYVAFAVFLLAPVTLLRWGVAVRRGTHHRIVALIVVALLAGVPFGLLARYGVRLFAPAPAVASLSSSDASAEASAKRTAKPPRPPESAALAAGGGHLEKQLHVLPAGGHWYPPGKMGGLAFVLLGFAALAFGLRDPRTRVGAGVLGFAAVSCGLVLFWPALCTWIAERGRLEFALPRLVPVLSTLLLAGIATVVGKGVARVPRPALAWSVAVLLVGALGTQLLGHAPRSFGEHWEDVSASREQRRTMIDMHQARRELLRAHVPRGATVLAEQRLARYVVMLHDVRVLAADRGVSGVRDLKARRRDVDRMTARGTAWRERRALLHHHRLRYVVFEDRRRERYAWALERGRLLGAAGGVQVVALVVPSAPKS